MPSFNDLAPQQFEDLLNQAIAYLSLAQPLAASDNNQRKARSLPTSPKISTKFVSPPLHPSNNSNQYFRHSFDSLPPFSRQGPLPLPSNSPSPTDSASPVLLAPIAVNQTVSPVAGPPENKQLLGDMNQPPSDSEDSFVTDSSDDSLSDQKSRSSTGPALSISTIISDSSFTTPTSSCPTTPRKSSLRTTLHKRKSVTFNAEEIEEFCYFDLNTSPSDIISSPKYTTEDDEWDLCLEEQCIGDFRNLIHLTNFPNAIPFTLSGKYSRIESLKLNGNFMLGLVEVKNISFHKRVIVRYSNDNWKTHREVACNYLASGIETLPGGPPLDCGIDKFEFKIDVSSHFDQIKQHHTMDPTLMPLTKKLQFAVRYEVAGQVFWDNNHEKNYEVEMRRVFIKSKSSKPCSNFSNNFDLPPQHQRRVVLKKSASTSSINTSSSQPVYCKQNAQQYQFKPQGAIDYSYPPSRTPLAAQPNSGVREMIQQQPVSCGRSVPVYGYPVNVSASMNYSYGFNGNISGHPAGQATPRSSSVPPRLVVAGNAPVASVNYTNAVFASPQMLTALQLQESFPKSSLYAEADFSKDHDFGFIHRPSFTLYTPSDSLAHYVATTTV